MGYKTAVQVLREAEDLREKVLKKTDLLVDQQAWTDQQQLQSIYHQVLVLDLEYALDKKVEQDLWSVGFKNHISVLQEQARDKRNARRSDCQALLTWCLEAASGFYITLLNELCDQFDIDLPFRRRGNFYGQSSSPTEQLNLPQTSSCLYICQYCLVHLGDIARYRNQRKQAESFYKQAIQVSPTSGHPYNQLALLEASQGNKLSTVFYYIRGIALKNPFPAATTNLLSTLNSAVDKESPLEKVQLKITVNEFIQIFLATHALLQTTSDLKQAELGVKSLNSTMTALVATQSFTSDKLIKITAINLYALQQHTESTADELTEDEKTARGYILDLLAGSLSAFLIPVYTLKTDDSLLDYYALPAVKLLTSWIRDDPELLQEEVFKTRLQIWPSLCKLLNSVQEYLKDFCSVKFDKIPLPEDKALQGFKPLQGTFKDLDFNADGFDDEKTEKLVRAKRIVDFGLLIADFNVNNSKLIEKEIEAEGSFKFKPGCIQPDPTNDLLEAMKSFNVTEPSRRSGERKGGILKPQGSLEKSREERELQDAESAAQSAISKKDSIKAKRTKQNVALQSIFKKLEESKQVKFSVDEVEVKEHDKLAAFDKKSPPTPSSSFAPLRPPQPPPSSYKMGFVVPPPPQDYLSTLRNVVTSNQQQQQSNNLPPFPPNTEVPPPGMPKNLPPPMAFSQPPPPSAASQFMHHHPPPLTRLPPPPPPPNYQNPLQFTGGVVPSYPPPVAQKKDDSASSSSPWWSPQVASSNHPLPQAAPPAASRHDGYFSFNGNLGAYNVRSDYGKPGGNQAAGDMFTSPWSNFGGMSYDTSSVSMRQAMLKEANNSINPPPRTLHPHDNFPQNPASSAPGYSLFNANSWTPNLVGQLRTSKAPDGPPPMSMSHQSLFTGQGPQSLAQLLEQQKSHKSDQ